jgi:competence protein ComEA
MNMQGTERQRDGAVVIVVIALIYFAISYFSSLFPSQISDIQFGDKSFGPVVVGITGNAGFNGIFYLHEKARVCDLLGAGNIRDLERFEQIMLSEQLSTGKTVAIESHGGLRIVEMNNANKLALGIPIDINKATLEDLMLISGIGEKTAWQIIQFREKSGRFLRVEDLMKIHGIKDKKFQKLRSYFCTDDTL